MKRRTLWDPRRPANQPCRPLGKTLQCGSDSIFFRRRAGGDTLDAGEASLQGAHEQDMGSRRGVKGAGVGLGFTSGSSGNGGRTCSEVGRDYSIGSCGEVLSMDVQKRHSMTGSQSTQARVGALPTSSMLRAEEKTNTSCFVT